MAGSCDKLLPEDVKNNYGYEYNSQPFKFIGLPLYCVLIFILYWFIYCPLMYVKVRAFHLRHRYHDWEQVWPYYFWLVAFIIFLIIMALVVYLWRLTCKPKKQPEEINYAEKEKLPEKGIELDDIPKKNEKVKDTTPLMLAKTENLLETSPQEKPETPLTPREAFFQDLLENAEKSFNSSKEKLNETSSIGAEEKPQEYFVANVSLAKDTRVANIFMFVNAEEGVSVANNP